MGSSRDIFIGIAGIAVSFYGGLNNNIVALTLGLLLLSFNIALNVDSLERNINLLNAQVNTSYEIQRLWKEFENLKRTTNDKKR